MYCWIANRFASIKCCHLYRVKIVHLRSYGLTQWGRATHICVGKLTIIGSDNGLSPGRRQAIIWTNAGIFLIGPLGTNFSEILIGIQTFSFRKMHLKISSAKWRPFCLGRNGIVKFGDTRDLSNGLHVNVDVMWPQPRIPYPSMQWWLGLRLYFYENDPQWNNWSFLFIDKISTINVICFLWIELSVW